ncbi:unnamed protein product [Leptosia nina]|uniref:Uncharacterized protein n=1 Tax=Leptosia nina TaxID=320188 RepID=A0AAV1K1M7_9NEOP
MPDPEAVLAGLLACAWLWRIGSTVYAAYSISNAVGPDCLGTNFKHFVAGLQILITLVVNLIPLSKFPRISLATRFISIPSQACTLYYANAYIGPLLDSKRVTVLLYAMTLLSILETVYKVTLDWSRIE